MAYIEIYQTVAEALGIPVGAAIALMTVIFIWTIIWKGFAMWKSAKKSQIIWFIAFLIFNTVGILEILYIYVFSKMKFDEGSKPKKKPSKKSGKKK